MSESQPPDVERESALTRARTPDYNATREGDSWDRPDYEDLLPYGYEAVGRDEPEDGYPRTVEETPNDVVSQIAQWSLLGDREARTAAETLILPVCYGANGGTLSEDACLSARRFATQVGGITDSTAESARRRATELLEEEFDHDFSEEGNEESATDASKADTDDTDVQFREKHAAFRAADPEHRIVYGAVLLPGSIDHHGDFFRDSTVRSLADGFMQSLADPDAEPAGDVEYPDTAGVGGVMHAIFPVEHLSLAENTILSDDRVVGSEEMAREFPAGTWLQGWKVHDDQLWSLIAEDEVLTGFSIGMWVDGWEEYEPGELPDSVNVPDAVANALADHDLSVDDVFTGEVTSGQVHEVSIVDDPAVPEATHVAHKSLDSGSWTTSTTPDALAGSRSAESSHALAKAAGQLTESHDSCVEYLVDERGHSKSDADQLASYLQRVVNGEGGNAGTPEKSADDDSLFGRVKSYLGNDPTRGVDPNSGSAAKSTDHSLSDVAVTADDGMGVAADRAHVDALVFDAPLNEPVVAPDAPDDAWTEFLDALVEEGGTPFVTSNTSDGEFAVYPNDELEPWNVTLHVAGLSVVEASGVLANQDGISLELRTSPSPPPSPEPVSMDADDMDASEFTRARVEKAGRTLSERNERGVMAIHDLALAVLRDAGSAGDREPFADDPLADYEMDTSSVLESAHMSGLDVDSEEPMGAAARAESPRGADGNSTQSMTDDDVTELKESLADTNEKLDTLVESLAETSEAATGGAGEGEGEQELAAEAAEEVIGRLEERGAIAGDGDESADDPSASEIQSMISQLAENQKELNGDINDLAEMVSKMAEADGVSQQSVERANLAALNGDEDSPGADEGNEKAAFFGLE